VSLVLWVRVKPYNPIVPNAVLIVAIRGHGLAGLDSYCPTHDKLSGRKVGDRLHIATDADLKYSTD